MSILDAIVTIVPYAATVGISIYAVWKTGQLKELELKDNERGRQFEVRKIITLKAVEAMMEANFRLGNQLIDFIDFKPSKQERPDPEMVKRMKDNLKFIEINKPFFPLQLREEMHLASCSLTNLIESYEGIDSKLAIEVLTRSVPSVQKAKKVLEQFMDKYNLLNES